MNTSTSELQIGNETDDYLIELIGLKNDFPQEALDAYGKIYARYWTVMLGIAFNVTKNIDEASDLLADTFNIVYNKASTFKIEKVKNPTNIKLAIQKWMTTIMKHVFYDHYLDEAYKQPDDGQLEDSYIIDKVNIAKFIDDELEDFVENIEEQEIKNNTILDEQKNLDNLPKVKEYISKLPERERDIILTFYDHYVPGKYTPTKVLDDLVNRWGTTRENIRKILEKFRKKIKEDLQNNLFIRK